MSLPRYLQIHAQLKKQILTGKFEEGSMLPSENQLSLQHNITRSMVRQALNELEKEGLIRKQQGKGSIVERKDQRLGLLSFRGFSEVIGGTTHQASSRLLQPLRKKKWSEDFFFELDECERNHGCIVIKRLREVDGLPVMMEHTYLPDILNGFLEKEWENGSLFKTLQVHYQVQVRTVEQYVRAIMANDTLEDYLKLEKNTPLLKINRKYSSSKEGFFIYSTLYCNTENYAIGSFME